MLRSRWDIAAGHRLHARVTTRTPKMPGEVVLVHGVGVSSLYMRRLARRLAPWRRTWAPDLPGFGRSPGPARALDVPELAEALRAWMDAAGIRRALLVGNSVGCQIAVELAARWPERAEGLVLVGPAIDRRQRTIPRQLARWAAMGVREPPTLIPVLAVEYLRAGLRRTWRTFRLAMDYPMDRRLQLVSAPVLVLRGGRDLTVTEAWAEEVTRRLPDGRLIEIPDGSHALHFARPGLVAGIVRDFMA